MSAVSSSKKPLLKLLDLVVTNGTPVFWLLATLGILGFLGVPLLERKNHFDENALLAGSHNPTFRCVAVTCFKLQHSPATATQWHRAQSPCEMLLAAVFSCMHGCFNSSC
jgi:hypothetical protein